MSGAGARKIKAPHCTYNAINDNSNIKTSVMAREENINNRKEAKISVMAAWW